MELLPGLFYRIPEHLLVANWQYIILALIASFSLLIGFLVVARRYRKLKVHCNQLERDLKVLGQKYEYQLLINLDRETAQTVPSRRVGEPS